MFATSPQPMVKKYMDLLLLLLPLVGGKFRPYVENDEIPNHSDYDDDLVGYCLEKLPDFG